MAEAGQELQSVGPTTCDFRHHHHLVKDQGSNVLYHDVVGAHFPAREQRYREVKESGKIMSKSWAATQLWDRGPHTADAWPPNTCTYTGTSTILGVLCYLLQADEFLQEGMTYRLGRSFYLAWTSVFFFMMTGLGWGGVGLGMGSGMQMGTWWDRVWGGVGVVDRVK